MFDLDELKAAIAEGSVTFQPSPKKRKQLTDIWGVHYMPFVEKICARLETDDFAKRWGSEHGGNCADVYGIQADTTGANDSDEAYAFYVKLGVPPRQPLDSEKFMLSFHPTAEIFLADGICLTTTVEGWSDDD